MHVDQHVHKWGTPVICNAICILLPINEENVTLLSVSLLGPQLRAVRTGWSCPRCDQNQGKSADTQHLSRIRLPHPQAVQFHQLELGSCREAGPEAPGRGSCSLGDAHDNPQVAGNVTQRTLCFN